MRRLVVASIALIVTAPAAAAQILPVPRRGEAPVAWTSLSAGFYDVGDVDDGSTGSAWRFGSAVQYRGSLEMDLNNGSGGLGVAIGFAHVPLTYRAGTVTGPASCVGGCDAHVRMWTVMATFHMGGGVGFQQIFDLGAGATFYKDFQADDDGTQLPPLHGDVDVSIAAGYGFGYGFTPRLAIMLVQDAAYTLHQREGLTGSARSNSQQLTTRIGVRYGLGSRAR